MSTEPRLIKVATIAPSDNTRADKIAIETAKTSKVTVVVAVMSIFSKKRYDLQNAKSGDAKPSCQKLENADFPKENPAD